MKFPFAQVCSNSFMAFVILFLSIGAPCFGAMLTDEEQRYLQEHPTVTMCVDPDWEPFERINEKGEHEGIAADLIRIVEERTGLNFELIKTNSWDESLSFSKDGRCQVLSFLNQTPNRDKWLIFSDPLYTDNNVFITREEHPYIFDPATLVDETIVLPSGTSMEELVKKDYPNIKVLLTDTERDAMNKVSGKQANMTMRSLIIAAYTIKKDGYFNLKIAGQLPNYSNKLRMGISGQDFTLRDIINKGIQDISNQERGSIFNKHVSINVHEIVNYEYIVKIAMVSIAVIMVVLFWNHQLKKHNKELARISRTDALTGLPNRLKINELLVAELLRSRRYGRPFSIMMLDVDYFKKINDEKGHLAGDAALVAIAAIARNALRASDVIGRWGGEEFLALCPETNAAEILTGAERLRVSIENAPLDGQVRTTVSVGVTTLRENETCDALLTRADKALYRAKENGRNQVQSL